MTFDVAAHIAGLARVRVGAGVLYRDGAGGVLLVRPTYKEGWEVPGGAVEASESPLAGARREVVEELGQPFPVGRLLVVDWVAPSGLWDAGLMFLFDGGTLDAAAAARIVLPPEELSAFAFVPVASLDTYLQPRLARRVRAALSADEATYLEAGRQPVGEAGRQPVGLPPASGLAPADGSALSNGLASTSGSASADGSALSGGLASTSGSASADGSAVSDGLASTSGSASADGSLPIEGLASVDGSDRAGGSGAAEDRGAGLPDVAVAPVADQAGREVEGHDAG
jgi:8-oxo-dGTP diphosphatase